MNKAYLVTALLAVLTLFALQQSQEASSAPYSFEQYKLEYRKAYAQGEEEYRKTVFLRNLVAIHEHNANPAHSWKMGVNQFTDLTEVEFAAIHLTLKVDQQDLEVTAEPEMLNRLTGASIDWEAENKITPVRDQGQCGSCWAIAAVGALESSYLIRDNKVDALSPQDVIDCSGPYGNQGCNGGLPDNAYKYIKDKGIALEKDYPYTAKTGKCRSDVKRDHTLKSYTDVKGCDNLVNALAKQAISSAVDATKWSTYASGILSDCGTNLNHGVIVIGVTDQYWRLQNMWGTKWGEKGYIRLARGNTCGVCQVPSYPSI
jgi:C1A family cysteine protease